MILTKRVVVFLIALVLCTNLYAVNDGIKNGVQLFESGELVKAKEFFGSFVKQNPENAEGYYYLGRIYFRENDLKKAEKQFKKAVKLEPNSSLYHTWLGHTYGNRINNVNFFKKMGMAKNIRKQYEKALELDETNTDALDGIITFHIEAPGIAGGDKDKAKEYAGRLKDLDKYEGIRNFARIYEKQKEYDLAEKAYKEAIAEFPDKINARYSLGYFYQGRAMYDKAFALFEQMLADSSENWRALYQIGRTGALSGQNLDRAEEAYKLYLQHEPGENSPSLANAHWRLGIVYEHKGKKDLAREEYRAALKLEPKLEPAKKALKKLK